MATLVARHVRTLVQRRNDLVARSLKVPETRPKHRHALCDVLENTIRIAARVCVGIKHVAVGVELTREIQRTQVRGLNAPLPPVARAPRDRQRGSDCVSCVSVESI